MSLKEPKASPDDNKPVAATPAVAFRDVTAADGKSSAGRHGLLNPGAEDVFSLLDWCVAADAYGYQLPLEGRSGAWVQFNQQRLLMLSSYDYLGLIGHPRVDEAAVDAVRKYGTGTGGARLLTGTIDIHCQLERELAAFKGTSGAISFGSGYVANLAAIGGLFNPTDRIILDSLAHRSLIDACQLAGAPYRCFRHNDMTSLRQELERKHSGRRTLIVADGVYSMDGDICPLPELVALKREYGCYLMIDESHSLGVLGATGRGVDEHFGVEPGDIDIWTASLGKALPSNGGFVALSQELVTYLQHTAAPFVFSGALCPPAVAAAREAIKILQEEPERVARLRANAALLRGGLNALGYDTGASASPIIPVTIGGEKNAALFARQLRDLGVLATPVTYPAVPKNQSRLRLCVTAAHTEEDLNSALRAFDVMRARGLHVGLTQVN